MSEKNNLHLPDFMVVGTAKAGTTSIFNHLIQHPDIAIPVKETFFFLKDRYAQNHLNYPMQRPKSDLVLDEDAYLSLYQNLEAKVVGEIATGYLYHHAEAIPLIQKYLGTDVKIAIILRDPVTRTFSSYRHFAKDLHEKISFEASLAREQERIAAGWDFMWHHQAMSRYARQVEAYLNSFPNVKVFFYEELSSRPEAFMESLYQFIDVYPFLDVDYRKRFNQSGEARNKTLQRLVTQENPVKSALRPLFRAAFGHERRARIRKYVKNQNLKPRQSITMEQRLSLEASFGDDVAALQRLTGVSLPWSSYKTQPA